MVTSSIMVDDNIGAARRPKIGLAGAGSIASILAILIKEKNLGDIALLDIDGGLSTCKSMDLSHSTAVLGYDGNYTAGQDYKVLEDCDVVIVTAGIPRKPWMKREDTFGVNSDIIKDVAAGIARSCPNAFVICITNPLGEFIINGSS